jgi:3-methyladenine DNA glycosylase AlkC
MKRAEIPLEAEPPSRLRCGGLARRKCDVPPELARALSTGERETTTWTEWMAVDTARLALTVARELPQGRLRRALIDVSNDLAGKGILDRLNLVGRAVASAVVDFDSPSFRYLVTHRSDAVRQWCAYAVNYPQSALSLERLLAATLPFAADSHMSVRECAWMAFRPFLIARLDEGLRLLSVIARSQEPRVRRFAVEVSRPRSVWGRHCTALKKEPALGRPVLEAVRGESNRYTQLSVGNWLNDASKSRPDWVQAVCDEWSRDGDSATNWMARRGMRTLTARTAAGVLPPSQATFHQFVPLNRGGG